MMPVLNTCAIWCSGMNWRTLLTTHQVQGACTSKELCHAHLDKTYVVLELIVISRNYVVSFSDRCLVSFILDSSQEVSKNFSWEWWKCSTNLLDDDTFVGSVRKSLGPGVSARNGSALKNR